MLSYVVTQALTAVFGGMETPGEVAGATYHVRKPRDPRRLYTVSIVATTSERFSLVESATGREVGELTSNFIKSRYEFLDGARSLGSLAFPAVAFDDKTLLLTVGEEVFEGDGGVFRGVFVCRRPNGDVVLEIAKELSIRDTFSVKADESLPLQVALLAAVALHSRFYEMV